MSEFIAAGTVLSDRYEILEGAPFLPLGCHDRRRGRQLNYLRRSCYFCITIQYRFSKLENRYFFLENREKILAIWRNLWYTIINIEILSRVVERQALWNHGNLPMRKGANSKQISQKTECITLLVCLQAEFFILLLQFIGLFLCYFLHQRRK